MSIISRPETEDAVPSADQETDATRTLSLLTRTSEPLITVLTKGTTGLIQAARVPPVRTDLGTTGGIAAAEAPHLMAATGKARACMVSR